MKAGVPSTEEEFLVALQEEDLVVVYEVIGHV